MAFFDTVEIDGEKYHIKFAERENKIYKVGDVVGPAHIVVPVTTYSIEMGGNTYLNIQKGKVLSKTKEPLFTQVVNEWGATVSYVMAPVEIPERRDDL